MKLYYTPGACSLSPHIILRESGLDFSLERVDLKTKTTEQGSDYRSINLKGQVPALLLDDGSVLTECAVILQYLADRVADRMLLPAEKTLARYHHLEYLNAIATELHKGFSPLFHPGTPEEYKRVVRQQLESKFTVINQQLANKQWLAGNRFSVVDAYLFTVLRWAYLLGFTMDPYPHIAAFMTRMEAKPSVGAALQAEGL